MESPTVDHVLATTRAVRRRLDLDRPVERDVLLECLELAAQAPTGQNAQAWRWVVVTDPDVRRELAGIYRRGWVDYLASVDVTPRDAGGHRIKASADHLTEVIDRVPVHVIPCIKGRPEGLAQYELATFYGSILPAVWSFMLALRSRGIGSSFTTLHLIYEREAAELLGIPEDVTQVALLPLGYITGGDLRPAERLPVDKIAYWNGWRGRAG